MFSRPLAFLLLGLGCVTAAAGGAYVAARHNAAETAPVAATAPQAATAAASNPAAPQPVAETESAVTSAPAASTAAAPAVPTSAERPDPSAGKPAATSSARRPDRAPSRPATAATTTARNTHADPAAPARPAPAKSAPVSQPDPQPAPVAAPPPAPAPEPAKPFEVQPEPPKAPQFEDVILPAASVIGLQMESSLSSERARVEDRVEARVTRDVLSAGRVAIPAGSRVIGSVTLVDRGGKVKEQARLGVRFHTLILADGSEVALNTDQITRNGESPAGSSAKKIGGAAVGGAILGAILGGGKGAAIGAGAGAAGGSAAVMAGDRNAATLRQGEIINARLTSPATITVERREQ
jgi:hypothetical protein